ncbi:hypothetical protein D3C74_494970 [compost metagenome]
MCSPGLTEFVVDERKGDKAAQQSQKEGLVLGAIWRITQAQILLNILTDQLIELFAVALGR